MQRLWLRWRFARAMKRMHQQEAATREAGLPQSLGLLTGCVAFDAAGPCVIGCAVAGEEAARAQHNL